MLNYEKKEENPPNRSILKKNKNFLKNRSLLNNRSLLKNRNILNNLLQKIQTTTKHQPRDSPQNTDATQEVSQCPLKPK